MDAIVSFELSKRFPNGTTALDNVSLRVPEGSAFACVGGENCGKTTLIRILSGLCRPTGGDCSVVGLSPFYEAERLHAKIGAVLNTAKLYEELTVSENLQFFASLNGVDENDALDRLSQLLHMLDIWDYRDSRVSELTTGARLRASLSRALMGSPEVLLMDEPGGGLDRETADAMRDVFSYLIREEGMTVFLGTRNMEYAESLCQGYAVLKDGILLGAGDIDTLRGRVELRSRAVFRFADGEEGPPEFTENEDGLWEVPVRNDEEFPGLISNLVGEGRKIYGAQLIKPTLREVYEAFLEGKYRRAGDEDETERDAPENGGGEKEDSDTPQAALGDGEDAG